MGIRQKILQQRNIAGFKKGSRKIQTVDELTTVYNKTPLMKLVELKFSTPLHELIMEGNIYELEKKLSIDSTTISKWRKIIREATNVL